MDCKLRTVPLMTHVHHWLTRFSGAALLLAASACGSSNDGDPATDDATDSAQGDGDGDGSASGDGDGSASGDGDGSTSGEEAAGAGSAEESSGDGQTDGAAGANTSSAQPTASAGATGSGSVGDAGASGTAPDEDLDSWYAGATISKRELLPVRFQAQQPCSTPPPSSSSSRSTIQAVSCAAKSTMIRLIAKCGHHRRRDLGLCGPSA